MEIWFMGCIRCVERGLFVGLMWVCGTLGTVAHGADVGKGATDRDLAVEMGKLINWINVGTPEQRLLAADALRMAPAGVIPVIKAALDGGNIKGDAEQELRKLYEDQVNARARYAALSESRRALGRTFMEGYEKVGIQNEKWNDKARALINEVYVEEGESNAFRLSPWISPTVLSLSEALREEKCTDPLVNCTAAWAIRNTNQEDRIAIAKALLKSGYPSTVRAITAMSVLLGPVTTQYSEKDKAGIYEVTLGVVGLLKEIKGQGLSDQDYYLLMRACVTGFTAATDGKWISGWKEAEPRLVVEVVDGLPLERLRVMMCFSIAMEYRGTKLPGDTPPADWAAFEKYSEKAMMLGKAYLEKDPTRAGVVRVLMWMGNTNGMELGEQEKLYRRSLSAEPDFNEPLRFILESTRPRWSGGDDWRERMMHHIHAAALSRNYEAGTPQMVAAMLRVPQDELNGPELGAFYRDDDIRQTIRWVYGTAMKAYPSQETLTQACMAYVEISEWFCAKYCYERMVVKNMPVYMRYKPDVWANAQRNIEMLGDIMGREQPASMKRPKWAP